MRNHGNARNNKPPTVFSSLLIKFAACKVKPLEKAPVFKQNIVSLVGATLSQDAKPLQDMSSHLLVLTVARLGRCRDVW